MGEFINNPVLVLTSCASLAVLMGQAALHKLFHREAWIMEVGGYGYGALASWLAPVVVLLELGLCAGLLSPWHAEAAGACALLLLVYGAAMARVLLQGRTVRCGCGAGELPVSWMLVARNVALALWACAGTPAIDPGAIAAPDLLWVSGGVLVGLLLYVCFHQVLVHAGYLASWRRQQGGVR